MSAARAAVKIELENGMAVVKSDDGVALFQIALEESGVPAVSVRSVAPGFWMNRVRYQNAIDIRPRCSNSVELVMRLHPDILGGYKLPSFD